jgi:hypothetical protein
MDGGGPDSSHGDEVVIHLLRTFKTSAESLVRRLGLSLAWSS